MIRKYLYKKESIFGIPTTKEEEDYVPTEKLFVVFLPFFLLFKENVTAWGSGVRKRKDFFPPFLA